MGGDLASRGGATGLSLDSWWQWLDRQWKWVALLLVLVNLALKLPHIGTHGLFLDEAVAIFETQGSISETIAFSAKDPTPPLYYLLLGAWCKLFGYSEASARFPSLLFSALTAGLLFVVGRRNLGVRIGLFAGLFFTASGIGVVFAQEARSYALSGLLMTLSYFLWLELASKRKEGWLWWLCLMLTNLALVYTHYVNLFGIGAQCVGSLWLMRHDFRRWLRYAGLQFIVVGLWLPWFLHVLRTMPKGKVASWLAAPGLQVLEYVATHHLGHGWAFYLGLGLVVGAGIWSLVWRRAVVRENWLGVWTVMLWAILALAFQFVVACLWTPVFDLRYTIYVLPGVHLGIAMAVGSLPRRLVLPLAAVYLFLNIGQLDLGPRKLEDWRGAVAKVKDLRTPGSQVVVGQYYQMPSFAYYFDRGAFARKDEASWDLQADNVHFGSDSLLLAPLDGKPVDNWILVFSQSTALAGQGSLLDAAKRRACVVSRHSFAGVSVYQLRANGCPSAPYEDYEGGFLQDQRNRIVPEGPGADAHNNLTFVGSDHAYSAIKTFRAGDLLGVVPAKVHLRFKAHLGSGGERLFVVVSMEHLGKDYNYSGLELTGVGASKQWQWVSREASLDVLMDPDDPINVYFWSPDGKQASFDSLQVEVDE